MPKICVVGTGDWGKNLVRNFHNIGGLHGVCDRAPDVLNKILEQYPDAKGFPSFDSVLAEADIDGVVLASPAEQHYEMTSRALEAGKHVFCEKPLALEPSDGEQLCELAERKGLILMVGHVLEYHPAVCRLKELVDQGELGRIHYIYSNRLNLGKFRKEENILWSFAPHDISAFLLLLEEEPESVRAFGGAYLQREIVDVTISTLSFRNGVRAHIYVSWLHPYKEQRLIVIGERRMAVFNDVEPKEKLLLYDTSIEWLNRTPVAKKPAGEPVEFEMVEPLRVECEHFLDCIEHGRRPKTDGRSALRVLRVLKACQMSLEQNGEPVELDDVSLPPAQTRNSFFAHPTSVIDPGCEIGEGTRIWHFSHVLRGSRIGKNCNIGQNVVIGPDVSIGDNVKIQNNVCVFQGVRLEDDVFCGPSLVFTNVINPRSRVPRRNEFQETVVEKGATLGANATIVCGVRIGKYALVGAGSVLTRDVPAFRLVYGNPARPQGWACWCGEKLDFGTVMAAACTGCGRKYRKLDDEEIEELSE